MRNPIKALMAWDERRWRNQGIEKWERRRIEGKWMFVLKFGLLWGILMIVGLTLIEYLFDGKLSQLIHDYKKARDVVGDIPIKAQVLSFMEMMYIKIRFNIPFASATTYDIEYNG